MVRIVADENIPLVADAFAGLGRVEVRPGRALRPEHLRDVEILLVRSVTRVDRALLDGTPVRFVGTATIGTDHVDTEYLRQQGIAFAAAAGCNADSVAEYVVAALLALRARGRVASPARPTVGIIGVGRIGRRVAAKLRALDWPVLLNDPPRQRREGGDQWLSLDELVAASDVLTCHVPLARGGADRTFHLLDSDRLGRLRENVLLINTARGPVIDNAALRLWLETAPGRGAVLDVWEGEPHIDPALARRAWLATPHIAGYSQDGKLEGTRMMHEAVCQFLGTVSAWVPPVPAGVAAEVVLDPSLAGRAFEDLARDLICARYPIERDDAALRAALDLDAGALPGAFDRLRRDYPTRWEWHHTRVRCVDFRSDHPLPRLLAGLGFTVAAPGA